MSKPVSLILTCIAAASIVVVVPGCGRKPSPQVADDAPAPPAPRTTAMTDDAADDPGPRVAGEWRMQRGRFTDVYRLVHGADSISGNVDAAGIGTGIAVSGSLKDGHLTLEWKASGASAISEDAKADYQFRFEGDEADGQVSGTATLTGHHLAKGVKTPVVDAFQAVLGKPQSP